MNRSQRRAAMRLTQKSAQTTPTTPATAAAPAPLTPTPAPATAPSPSISEAQLGANRLNAQASTGPKTDAGRAVSSLNAVKTGLTGRIVLLPADDAAAYQNHLDRIYASHAPATDDEKQLVQLIADTEWRLLRIAPLEAGIYALGHRELADMFQDEKNPVTRQAMITAEVFRTHRKELNNLALQERRLRNQRQADINELKALQQKRLEEAEREAKKPAAAKPAAPPPNGFVFSVQPAAPENTPATPEITVNAPAGDEESEKAQAA